jgi:hypothetical protein
MKQKTRYFIAWRRRKWSVRTDSRRISIEFEIFWKTSLRDGYHPDKHYYGCRIFFITDLPAVDRELRDSSGGSFLFYWKSRLDFMVVKG